MKRASILAAVLLLAACSPQVYPLYLDVRQPSPSGMDLSKKSMSIVYMDGHNQVDSLFDRQLSSAMARYLEEDYFGGKEVVGIYHIPSADTVTVEDMHALVMDTEKDVIFLLTTHLDSKTEDGGQPVSTRLMVYDSMGEDKIRHFSGSAVLHSMAPGDSTSQAEEVARRISSRFISGWKTQSFSFYYFDDLNADEWIGALEHVSDGAFSKAIDIWMPMVTRGYNIKRACAAYNLAMAFYLLEDYEISSRWLDVAAGMENLSQIPGLRKRLEPHLEKTQ